ncbi:MAG TPA: peptidylprolyl isomerase [Tepidisphaeraceae bacterium]|nr:peptidylprolyl isomerase [Tepidisphaeraceae bacterium]
MKRIVGVMVIGTAFLAGCSDNNSPAGDSRRVQKPADMPANEKSAPAPVISNASVAPAAGNNPAMSEVIAQVRGEPITMKQLMDPLIESHGLSMLFSLVELELVKQDAAKSKAVVTDQDIADERERQLEKMFEKSDDPKLVSALDKAVRKKDAAAEAKARADIKQEREDYLIQLLANKNLDRVEWEIGLKVNTYLRKILETEYKDKITDKELLKAFGQLYGEKVKVRYIELGNMTEVAEAQRRLQHGDSFEQVAIDMSHDRRTGQNGGELEAFSRATPDDFVPAVFKDTAFALKDGQISDVVAFKSAFLLIKRINLIPPKAVIFEDEKDPVTGKVIRKGEKEAVRRKLNDTLFEAGMKGLKEQLAVQTRKELKILDPELARQFKEATDRKAKADAAARKAQEELDFQQHRRDMLKKGALTQPSDTQPSGTAPATTGDAAPQAPSAAAGERPPATQPGPALPPLHDANK